MVQPVWVINKIDESGNKTEVPYIKHPISKAGEFDEPSFKLRNKQVEQRTSELRLVSEITYQLATKPLQNFWEKNKPALKAFQNRINLEQKFHLVGHSFGGGTVMNLVGNSEPNTR